jgi:hypothetical protein
MAVIDYCWAVGASVVSFGRSANRMDELSGRGIG